MTTLLDLGRQDSMPPREAPAPHGTARRRRRKRRVPHRWLGPCLALAVLAGAGCAGEDTKVDCELAACDIFESDCQAQLMQALACRRGSGTAHFDVATAPGDEPPPPTPTPEQVLVQQRQMSALALFSLAPADWSLEGATTAYQQSIPAFYDSSQGLIVVSGSSAAEALPPDDPASLALMTHEIVHVLRDAETGLSSFYASHVTTFDGWLAARAVVEGEAQLHATLTRLELMGTSPDAFDWEAQIAAQRDTELAAFEHSPSPFWMADRYLVYSMGLAYVLDAWRRGGLEAISALYDAPPVSTRQVTAGYGAPEPFGGPWSEISELAQVARPQLSPPQEDLGTFVLGAWLVDAFVQRALPEPSHDLSWNVLSGLRADALTLLYDVQADAPMATWRMRFANETLASEMLELADWPAHVHASRDGRDAIFVAGAAAEDPTLTWIALSQEPEPAAASPVSSTDPERRAASPPAL